MVFKVLNQLQLDFPASVSVPYFHPGTVSGVRVGFCEIQPLPKEFSAYWYLYVSNISMSSPVTHAVCQSASGYFRQKSAKPHNLPSLIM